jgi:hypothetical protein
MGARRHHRQDFRRFMMLSKSERETLSDMERDLALKDPDLAKKLSAPTEPPPGRRGGWVTEMLIGIATLLAAFALLAGAYHQALGYAVICGLVAWVSYGSVLRPVTPRQRQHRTKVPHRLARLNPPANPPDEGTQTVKEEQK